MKTTTIEVLTLFHLLRRCMWCCGLLVFFALSAERSRATIIFDNRNGVFNGLLAPSTTSWLAARICLGPQPYSLDDVTFLLSNGGAQRPYVSTVRLQLYSDNPANTRPVASTGPMLILSGLTNPITLNPPDGFVPVTWVPAAPFTLAPNTCYWFVLSVDSGDPVYVTVSETRPTGDAGGFGWDLSSNGGATWGAPDLFHNLKMLVHGTAIPIPLRVADGTTAIPGGTGNFTSFGNVSLSATDVAFLGLGANGQQGIYGLTGGSPVKVVDLTDLLEGRAITGLQFSRTGLFEDPVAFQATFADGSQGIYTMAIVAPPFELRITGVEKLGNDLWLSFPSLFGTNYAIQSRADLSSGMWATLPGTTSSGTGGTVQQMLSDAFTGPKRFYRVQQVP